MPCLQNPGKIICVGTNYRRHAREVGLPIPEYPLLFSKFNSSLSAHGQAVAIPYGALQVDYEAELAFVIGKTARHVAREDALHHVFGYCNANDLSARDWQMRTGQWLLGKTCDGFCPLGPYLVTADEIADPNALGIRTFVNDELRQNSNTQDMIFHCDELISYISRHMTLSPGDVVLTGTPEGVILGYPEERRVWLGRSGKCAPDRRSGGSGSGTSGSTFQEFQAYCRFQATRCSPNSSHEKRATWSIGLDPPGPSAVDVVP